MKKLFLILSLSPATFNNFIVKRKVLFIFVSSLFYHSGLTLVIAKRNLLILLWALFIYHTGLINIAFAQPNITWQRSYDDGFRNDNEGRDICLSNPGTYFVVGHTTTNGQAQVVKINDMGDSLWSRFYPAVGFWPTRCVSSENGSCVMVGERGSNSRVKLDASGNIIWNIPNDTFPSEFYGLIKTTDNNFVACGSAGDPIIGYIMKFDSLGGIIWGKSYPTPGYMRFYSLTEAYNGGYLACGTESDGNFVVRGAVIRIDGSGNEIWRKYPPPNPLNRSCNSIRRFQGNYLVIGGNGDTSSVMKLDTSGNLVYKKFIPPPKGIYSGLVNEIRGEVYKSNEVIFFHNAQTMSDGFTSIARLDSNFNELSSTIIDYPNCFSFLTGCLPLTNGDILFAGFIELGNWGNNNFYVIRTDSTLNSPLIAVQQLSSEIPIHSGLIKNYPNPFNPSTKIKFEISKKSLVSIKIYNSLGQEIETLINKSFDNGIYEMEWNAVNFASGIYYCTFFSDNNITNTLKLILTK